MRFLVVLYRDIQTLRALQVEQPLYIDRQLLLHT